MTSTTDNVHMLHKPNFGAIRDHLEILFHRAAKEYPDARVEIAWSDPSGQVNSANSFPITPEGLDQAAQEAVRRNTDRNVYVGVNPRRPETAPWGRAKAHEILCAYFQFADIDKPEGIARLRQKLPLNYTMAVTTGRTPEPRVHPYWELEEAVTNLGAWRAQQEAIADYFGSDRVIDAGRIMRLAGTVSYPTAKKAEAGYKIEPVTLRTIYDDERRDPVSSEAMFHAYPWTTTRHDFSDEHSDPGDETGPRPQPGADRFDTGRRDPLEFVRNIQAGVNLHNNARNLIAHLVNTGYRDWLIRDYLDRLLRPVSDGGTLGQIEELIRSARTKFNTADPEADEDFDAKPPELEPLNAEPVNILDPKARKPRQWLVPYRMMRQHITMTTAAPGVGKSTLAIEEAVSMASGVDFLGFGITEPLRVAVINNEETRDELERRVEATCQHFGIPFESIAGQLFLYSGVDNPKLVLVRADRRSGLIIPTAQLEQLRLLINTQRLDVVVLDPFVQLHYVEESSNEQISHALQQLRGLGNSTHPAAIASGAPGCAIHVIHHNRKPAAGNAHQAGDMASARGASSMGGEAHFFFTLTDMGKEDAEQLNIPDHDRINYLRLDDAKRKMAPAQAARWFERYGEMMPYGLLGEEVGILIPLDKSELDNTTISSATATAILQIIDSAWVLGEPYSEYPQAKERYAINMIMREARMTRTAAKELLKEWIKNNMVATEIRDSHANLKGLRVLKWPG